MKTALLAAMLVAVSASFADAEKYVLRNGRASAGGSGGGRSSDADARSSGAPARQAGGGAGGGVVYGEPVSGGMAVARHAGGHRSFWGGGAQLGRNVYRVPQRAAEGGSGGEGGSAPEERPPYFDKPGALIRTEGHKQFQYAEAGNHREHTVSAGEIVLDPRKAHDVNKSHGLRVGAPDKLPPCTPGTLGCGSGGGGNSITPNSGGSGGGNTVVNNGAHDNENGNSGGNGNGNPFGGGTGFDPSF